jgi:hypothetical protein
VSRDPERHLAGLGEVPDAAAERVAARARERVARALERGGARHGERPVRRRGRGPRLAIVAGACALALAVVFGADELQDGRQQLARAAVLPLSSFDAPTRSLLRHEGLLGTAPLTQQGRADPIGNRLFTGRATGHKTTCVLLVARAKPSLLGARCLPVALGARRRPGDVFVRQVAPGRVAVDGLVGPQVRRVEITDAGGGSRVLTPRAGVFGVVVDGKARIALIDGDGRVLSHRKIGG